MPPNSEQDVVKVGHAQASSRRRLLGPLVACVGSLLLSACILTADQSIESDAKDPRAQDVTDKIRGLDLTARSGQPDSNGAVGRAQPAAPAIYVNDTGAPGGAGGDGVSASAASGEGFDLNFESAPVTAVAKVILGDVLGVGYSIDPRVQGTVTLASGRPIAKGDALFVLENALRMSSAALVKDRSGYRIIPAAEAAGLGGVDRGAATQPGYGMSIVPLRHVSVQTVMKLLDAFGVKQNTVRADPGRNLMVVTGTGPERSSAVDTIASFDADWMRGQSVGIFPLRNASAEPVIAELEKIMDSGDGGLSQGVVKLQPINRLNAVLVVSQKADYLRRAGTWIARLDRSDTEGDNLKVYSLRYGNARNVAALLNEMIVGRIQSQGGLDSAGNAIAPGSGAIASSSGGLGGGLGGLNGVNSGGSTTGGALTGLSAPGGGGFGGGSTGGGGFGGSSGGGFGSSGTGTGFGGSAARNVDPSGSTSFGNRIDAAFGGSSRTPGLPGASGAQGAGGQQPNPNAAMQNVRISADPVNNTVLVYANLAAQRIVEQTLRQIDRPLRQVAIEATIAEITLNDNLNYGVQFFLKNNTGSILNTIGTAAISRVVPGFNLMIGSDASPKLILDALHGVTEVKVLSNPSLVVLDNQIATLQVGDQVPISTGSATVLTTNNTIVNTIDYRNTGIILRVLPRSNANGNVVLDIEQEISNVGDTQNGTLTPTISQRRVKSTVSVTSGQTVMLAGLISDQENKVQQGIPLLDKLPGVVGDAFKHQNNTKKRIELILFIRPTVVRDSVDAQVIAEELRTKMNGRFVGSTIPTPVQDAPYVRRR